MGNIINSLFWKSKAIFIDRKFEGGDSYTFSFMPAQKINWKPGQYIDYKIGNDVRHFTIASAPYEKVLRITTRIFETPSDFKRSLMNMKKDEVLYISKPQGTLTIDDPTKNYLFIAGGIGITPFRAIIWDQLHKQAKTKMTLYYASSETNPPFKKELDKYSAKGSLSVKYFNGNQRINAEDIKAVVDRSTIFLISGPPKMVEAYRKIALSLKIIPKKNIKSDSFIGYQD